MRTVVIVVVVIATVAVGTAPVAAEESRPGHYVSPVDAPVVDGFRPPASPYGAGNRGLAYDLAPGSTVRAAGGGVVRHAGPVAGRLVVTVDHPDGVRTTYTGLSAVDVTVGTVVDAGDVIGRGSGPFHVGARVAGAYLDPSSLWVGGPLRVWLIPSHREGESVADAWDDETGGDRGVFGMLTALAGAGFEILRDGGGRLFVRFYDAGGLVVDVFVAELTDLWVRANAIGYFIAEWSPPAILVRLVFGYVDHVLEQRDCTAASVPAPGIEGRRILVTVGGLDSDDDRPLLGDAPAQMGYDPDDVVAFAYGGGRVAGTGAALDLPDGAYDPVDTGQDLEDSGRELAALLASVRAQAPGVPIDVVAHSQGGIVTRLALEETAVRPETVVTLGTPHRGADVGTAIRVVGTTTIGDVAGQVTSHLRPDSVPFDAPAVRQLSETSRLMWRMRSGRPPDGVRFRSVAARGDYVVSSTKTRMHGAEHVTVSAGTHSTLPELPTVHREIALAVAGMGVSCRSLADHMVDRLTGELISLGTDGLGLAVTGLFEHLDPLDVRFPRPRTPGPVGAG